MEKLSDSQWLGSICKTGLGFLLMCVTLLTMLKCTFDCFSILKTVQPEDLTNQTRVLESIERVLESLTEKTSNWKYKDMNIDSISEVADLNAPSSSHNIGHVIWIIVHYQAVKQAPCPVFTTAHFLHRMFKFTGISFIEYMHFFVVSSDRGKQ